MTPEARGRVLRLSLLGWGLGHLVLGRRATGLVLLAAEVLGVALVAVLTAALADTTAYLIPFLAGVAFLAAWAWQAVSAYLAARQDQAEAAQVPARSPAASIAWLSMPLLAWGTGYWLFAAQAATPAAVLDRFVSDWTDGRLAAEWPPDAVRAADEAGSILMDLCVTGALDGDCAAAADRFRDIRVRLTRVDDRRATAVAEAVRFERRASSLLGVFGGSELGPVAVERLLTFRLATEPAPLPFDLGIGAHRWRLVSVEVPTDAGG